MHGQVLGDQRAKGEPDQVGTGRDLRGDAVGEVGQRHAGGRRRAALPWPGQIGRHDLDAVGAAAPATGCHTVWSRPTPCSNTIVGWSWLIGSLLGGQRGQPLLRPALRRGGQRDHDLVGMRRIGDPHLHRLMVGADRGVGDVLERDVEHDPAGPRFSTAGSSVVALAALRKWSPNFSVWIRPEPCSISPLSPTIAALPYASAGASSASSTSGASSEPISDAVVVDARAQVFDESLAGPGVFDDGGDDGDASRRVDLAAALGADLLDDGDDLAKLHVRTLSRIVGVMAGSVVRSPMRGCGRGPVEAAATITSSSARGASDTRTVTVW